MMTDTIVNTESETSSSFALTHVQLPTDGRKIADENLDEKFRKKLIQQRVEITREQQRQKEEQARLYQEFSIAWKPLLDHIQIMSNRYLEANKEIIVTTKIDNKGSISLDLDLRSQRMSGTHIFMASDSKLQLYTGDANRDTQKTGLPFFKKKTRLFNLKSLYPVAGLKMPDEISTAKMDQAIDLFDTWLARNLVTQSDEQQLTPSLRHETVISKQATKTQDLSPEPSQV